MYMVSRTPSFFLRWEVLKRQDNPILPAYIFGTYMLEKYLMHAFFNQAARKEQRFKAIHKSNRAAEKIVKNYLKAKALETVTKRKRYVYLLFKAIYPFYDCHPNLPFFFNATLIFISNRRLNYIITTCNLSNNIFSKFQNSCAGWFNIVSLYTCMIETQT